MASPEVRIDASKQKQRVQMAFMLEYLKARAALVASGEPEPERWIGKLTDGRR